MSPSIWEARSRMLHHAPMLMIITPLTGALVLRITNRFLPSQIYKDMITFFSLLIPVLLLLFSLPRMNGGAVVYEMGGWPRPFGISLVLDGLSSLMVLLVGIVTICSFVYSLEKKELIPKSENYYFLFLFMSSGLYGVFLTGDIVNRFVFFEITILTTYVLITYTGSRASLRASYYYLVVGSVASVMFLTGIGLLYFYTGYLDMDALSTAIPALPANVKNIIFAFFLVAAGVKVAIVPFHTWLPDAHVSAPTPMTAILAGVTVKTGAYIMLKLFQIGFDTMLIRYLIAALGAITGLTAALVSMKYYDMKKILAWLTISHMGTMLAVSALWTPGAVSAGILYLINHTLYKTLLFLSVGALVYLYGTADIRRISLLKSNIILSAAVVIGLLSMAGLPPFNGFYGRYFLLETAGHQPVLSAVILLIHFLTALSVFRIFRLSGTESHQGDKLTESIMVPLVVLSGMCFVGGLTTWMFMSNMVNPASFALTGEFYEAGFTWHLAYRNVLSMKGVLLLLTVVCAYVLSSRALKLPLEWSDGVISEVSLPDTIRYIVIIIAVLLLLNFI
ncbi:MAG: proton-conducting transporter membrane subunit [Thermoplasmata archaeon]